MTQNITLDDFYTLFRESERQRQETERLLRQSLKESRQEFDRRLAESKAEFDRDLAESRAEIEQSGDSVYISSDRNFIPRTW